MKSRTLTFVGAFFVLLVVIIMVVTKTQKEPETKTTITEVREVQKTKLSRTNKPSQEIVVVEYSTKAFLNEGTPETEH